jgi:hypothetical protein
MERYLVEPLPNPSLDNYIMEDERAFCDLDSRLGYSEISIDGPEGSDGPLGAISIVSLAEASSFTSEYRTQLGLTREAGSVDIIGGGLAQFRVGIHTKYFSGSDRARTITALVQKAIRKARDRGAHPVALFVSEPDLSAFSLAADMGAAAVRQQCWCTLELGAPASVESFIASRDRKVRQTWRRDQRDSERLGLSYRIVEFSRDNTRLAAPFIADVAQRNGLAEPEQISRWRMSGYSRRPGRHFYIQSLMGSQTVAYTACRKWGDTLDAHSVGIDPSVDDRRSVYHYAAYLAPLRSALESDCSQVEYGYAHVGPKVIRGCAAVGMWRLDFGSAKD